MSFGYDIWANLKTATVTKCSAPALGLTINNLNRIADTGFGYDAAGNMTAEPGKTYTYDAENRMTAGGGVSYTYDGDGKRVAKSNGKLYWYGMGGLDALVETDGAGNNPTEYVFFGGKRIARRDPNGAVFYYFADHLGSSRVVTNSAGTVVEESDYYPFGGERVVVNNDANQYKFTGKERDSETGLDYFVARYYGSALGRFLSTDPLLLNRAMMLDPQRINLFAYARGNPLRYNDPDGAAPREVTITIRVRTYSVSGRTASEAHADIKNKSPNRQRAQGQTDHQYYTSYNAQVASVRGSADGGYAATVVASDIKTDATITVTVPQWEERNQAPRQEQEAWDRGANELMDHEIEHVAVAVEATLEISRAVEGASATGTGRTPGEAIRNASQNLSNEVQERQEKVRERADDKHTEIDKPKT